MEWAIDLALKYNRPVAATMCIGEAEYLKQKKTNKKVNYKLGFNSVQLCIYRPSVILVALLVTQKQPTTIFAAIAL